MLVGILDREYEGESSTTEAGTKYICKTVDNDFLHVCYAGLKSDEEKHLLKELKKMKKEGPKLEEYISFLSECNGALLFAGSINLFGFTLKRKDEDTPSLITDANKTDKVSKALNQVIYIGNMPCSDGGNINIYFNVNSGLVTGYYNGNIVITWTRMNDFLEKIINRYDKYYMPNGKNKMYGMNSEMVYNNIQKYNLKEI